MNDILVINENSGEVLVNKGRIAKDFWSRLKGLLGVKRMQAGEGLMILPCNRIHTIGMSMTIDVLFVSLEGEIKHAIQSMKPGKISPYIASASFVLELPAGQIKQTNTCAGQRIALYKFDAK